MKISITGLNQLRCDTIGKLLGEKLQYKSFSYNESLRFMAMANSMTIEEYEDYSESSGVYKELDEFLYALDDCVWGMILIGDTACHLTRNTIKVYINTDEEDICNSMYNHLIPRIAKERAKRYITRKLNRLKRLYDIDYTDISAYDLIIDIANKSDTEIVEELCSSLKLLRVS